MIPLSPLTTTFSAPSSVLLVDTKVVESLSLICVKSKSVTDDAGTVPSKEPLNDPLNVPANCDLPVYDAIPPPAVG